MNRSSTGLSSTLDLASVYEARKAIAGMASRTPIVASPELSRLAGSEVVLKLETLQPIGAFKIRGAANALAHLAAGARGRGVVCCSTGNHGRAVAYAARAAGVKAVICLSSLVPRAKVAAIEALGAEVCRIGASQDEAQEEVERLVREEGFSEVPPFDHPHVIAGQGTIAIELLEERPDLSAVVVPLSGGGLVGGIALAAKAIKPAIRIVGVTMAEGAAMHESLKAGKPVAVTEVASLADSLGGGIGLDNRWTYRLCRDLVDETLLVEEDEIYRGMQALFRNDRVIAEGGAAVGVAAVMAGKLALDGPTAMVVSGHNVDMDQFLAVVSGRPVKLGERTVGG